MIMCLACCQIATYSDVWDAIAYRLQGCLEVTRSFGDLAMAQYGLSATPYVCDVTLEPQDDVALVVATDGLWDVVDENFVTRVVLEELGYIHPRSIRRLGRERNV